MTLRGAVPHQVIFGLAIAFGLPCAAATPYADVFGAETAVLPSRENGLFLAVSLAAVVVLLAIRVARNESAAAASGTVPSLSIPTADKDRRSVQHETPTRFPGFAIDRASTRSRAFGGDFCLTTRLKGRYEGCVLVVVGDVSGYGTRTAVAVFKLVQAIDALAQKFSSPGALLAQINSRVHGHLQGETATCLALRLDPRGCCVVASAGHPSPMMNGRELALENAIPLGILPEAAYADAHFTLCEDDFVALYTNGLSEARNHSGELFGFGRLAALFGSRPSAREASQKAIEFGQRDDVTVLTVTRLRTAAARAAGQTSPEPLRQFPTILATQNFSADGLSPVGECRGWSGGVRAGEPGECAR